MAYANCKWCHGSGCVYCEVEREKEVARRASEPNSDESEFGGLLRHLVGEINKSLSEEVIDGCSVLTASEDVMLDIAFSPVLMTPFNEMVGVPSPAEAIPTEGGESYILRPLDGSPEEVVGKDSLKSMRARFLLVKGHYYKRLCRGGFANGEQQKVVAWYFRGSVWIPPEGPLKAMLTRK